MALLDICLESSAWGFPPPQNFALLFLAFLGQDLPKMGLSVDGSVILHVQNAGEVLLARLPCSSNQIQSPCQLLDKTQFVDP